MRYLSCSNVFSRALFVSAFLLLPTAPLFALKPPGDAVQQPAPAPAEPPSTINEKSVPAVAPRTAPATPRTSERVQADSAVSFPVDI